MHRMVDHNAGVQRRGASTGSKRLRTCIATRIRCGDSTLLRIVVDPQNASILLPDPRRRLPGRGAWLTPTTQALDLAEKRRAFSRALKVSTQVDTSRIREYLSEKEQAVRAGVAVTEKEDRTLMSTR